MRRLVHHILHGYRCGGKCWLLISAMKVYPKEVQVTEKIQTVTKILLYFFLPTSVLFMSALHPTKQHPLNVQESYRIIFLHPMAFEYLLLTFPDI